MTNSIKQRESDIGYNKIYTREHTQAAMLLGGVGTGSISIGSRGQLFDYELFNAPSKGLIFPYTFFAIHAENEEHHLTRVLESRLTPPYVAANGLPAQQLGGLPRFRDSEMKVNFPFVNIRFVDESLPFAVELEAFNPFIPLNADDSGIPAALFRYKVKNTSNKPLTISVAGSLYNASGYSGQDNYLNFKNRGNPVNKYREEQGLCGLFMDNDSLNKKDKMYGNLALITPLADVSYKAEWQMGQRVDGAHGFWNDFDDDGRFSNEEAHMGVDSRLDRFIPIKVGSLALTQNIDPGQEASFPFVISWYFPNRQKAWPKDDNICSDDFEELTLNYYATLFDSAWDAGTYLLSNLNILERDSRNFADAIYRSTMPEYVIDAITANLAILKSTTCFRIENGHMFGFEGCLDEIGSCPGNCTHVWNYAQAMAFIFPELEQSMRRTDFLVETDEDGLMQFRAMRELNGQSWGFIAASDGQMGTIVRLYREWLITGDDDFLRDLWAKAKLALDYAIKTWDTDGDLVLDGMKHVDYDVEFYGIEPLSNILYLAALKAASQMARYLGELNSYDRYLEIYEKASVKADELMWNEDGGYYIQLLEDVDEFKYQHGKGCLSDQLLGQFMAYVCGLGPLMNSEHMKQAALSIFRHNYLDDLTYHANMQRVYAVNDDKGLLMTTWPIGGRPKYPFFYSEEVWSRTEYPIAATLIYEGFIDEGLTIVKAIRERYDGIKRNPWNEFECGWHYSGTMGSWGLLIALSGYHVDIPAGKMSFSPKINQDDFRTFWSNGRAWGTYTQKKIGEQVETNLEILYGSLDGIELY